MKTAADIMAAIVEGGDRLPLELTLDELGALSELEQKLLSRALVQARRHASVDMVARVMRIRERP